MGIPAKTRPEMPDEATRLLRCRLMLEETLEYIRASGFSADVAWARFISMDVVSLKATHAPDLAAMAAENADVRYIAHGNDLAMGVDVRVFAAVHEANMRKAPGGIVVRRQDGKVVKPEGWQPADVARLLREWEP
jgi:predicted HAD superfamily Cof-like phosphohydrolase